MLENLLDFNLLRISPECLILTNPLINCSTLFYNMVYNLSKTRSEVKIIDNSVVVVVHELELAIKREL